MKKNKIIKKNRYHNNRIIKNIKQKKAKQKYNAITIESKKINNNKKKIEMNLILTSKLILLLIIKIKTMTLNYHNSNLKNNFNQIIFKSIIILPKIKNLNKNKMTNLKISLNKVMKNKRILIYKIKNIKIKQNMNKIMKNKTIRA